MPIFVLSIVLALVSAALIFVSVRLILFKNAAKRIVERLDFILSHDTNLGIDLEFNEKTLKMLTFCLNGNINKLKQLKNDYKRKDIELREAIANVSHDLRTPLTVITSYINLIERGKVDIGEKNRNALEIVKNRTVAMNSLIEELFNYSLYESEQFSLEFADVCLNDCVEKSLTEFYHIITEQRIQPDINICSEKVVRCVDIKAYERIVNNILSNAVKYTSGDLNVTLNEDGEAVFSNTTENLDTVAVGKLFNRFFTVESGGVSTGLGLSIAKVLAERMGGSLRAELNGDRLSIFLKV